MHDVKVLLTGFAATPVDERSRCAPTITLIAAEPHVLVDTGDVNVQVGAQVSAFGYATAVYYAAGPNQLRLSEPPVIVAR